MKENVDMSPRWISGIEPAPELLAADGTQILELECRQQPRLLAKIIRDYARAPEIQAQLRAMRESASRPGPVLFIGMGGSLCSAISASTMLQTHGRSSWSVDAGEWLNYASSVWADAALSVLLTTSGESAELVELIKQAGNQPMALISNNPASTGWRLSRYKLPILAGPEYGNATKTYTNATAAGIILASEILNVQWRGLAEAACDIFAQSLDRVFNLRNSLEQFTRGATNIEIIGRGAAYGAAIMGALTIREMSGFRAAPHTGAGFKHGPNLDVDGTHVAIIFALGRVAHLGVKLANECIRRGGKVILVSSEERDSTDLLLPVRLEPVAEPWEGVTSILIPQALTLAMIERNGCRLPPRFQYGVMEQ